MYTGRGGKKSGQSTPGCHLEHHCQCEGRGKKRGALTRLLRELLSSQCHSKRVSPKRHQRAPSAAAGREGKGGRRRVERPSGKKRKCSRL
ncbi:hypothetical protein CEXT_331721 [Caerostris extrusa]|uniref:Uncharacterized protein n=1 Tax=Caerostris extrusa TaxID=172846 RepID=A0AAV4TI86_CAEEX|nr:hypothetical protein CEXT_331721 [Caerostris extrusa]